MHFEDLSNDTYVGRCPYLKSIGWLGSGHEFMTGDPPEDLVPLLKEHLADHWGIFAAAGKHDCEFCAADGRMHADSRNLFIPSSDTVYLAPGMIVHYIVKHGYLPPHEFIEAVRKCPPQGSENFMSFLKDFGTWWDKQMCPEDPKQGEPDVPPNA